MSRVIIYGVAAAMAAALQPAMGQTLVGIRGIAYDSLGKRPLASAIISLGAARTTFADSLGHFSFDSVAPGPHRLTMEHAAIDALGLAGISVSVEVRSGMEPIRMAIPSFATMWGRVCGPASAPENAGVVFGVVRDALTRKAIPNADVVARWFEAPTGALAVRSWKVEGKSDENGSYALCGIPTSATAHLAAAADTTRLAMIDLELSPASRVIRRDLSLWGAAPMIPRGTVTGIVRSNGKPVPDARVLADWTEEVVTGRDGSFTIVGVPTGTRQIQVIPLGPLAITSHTVDVVERDTTRAAITIDPDRKEPPPTLVQARIANEFALRRRSGVGYFRDSTHLGRYANFFAAFADLQTAIVQSRPGGIRIDLPECADAPVWIDGIKAPTDVFLNIRPSDLSGVEIYQRYETPADLRANGISIGPRRCAVLLWLKRQ